MSNQVDKYDKIKTWVAVLALGFTVGGGGVGLYVKGEKETTQLAERVDQLIQSNARSYEVFARLADSVDRLSQSVARLDERTRALERD